MGAHAPEGFEDASAILRSGCYALALRGQVVYIGQSKNLYVRIYTHRNLAGRKLPWAKVQGIRFDEVFIRPCPVHELAALEAELIRKYQPRLNKQLKGAPLAPPSLIAALGLSAPKALAPSGAPAGASGFRRP